MVQLEEMRALIESATTATQSAVKAGQMAFEAAYKAAKRNPALLPCARLLQFVLNGELALPEMCQLHPEAGRLALELKFVLIAHGAGSLQTQAEEFARQLPGGDVAALHRLARAMASSMIVLALSVLRMGADVGEAPAPEGLAEEEPDLQGVPDLAAIAAQPSTREANRMCEAVWAAAAAGPQQAVQVLVPALQGI